MRMDNLKEQINTELSMVAFTGEMKANVRQHKRLARHRTGRKVSPLKYAAAAAAVLLVCGTTAAAARYVVNELLVNGEKLPELDPMEIVQAEKITGEAEEGNTVYKEFSDYASLRAEFCPQLLDSELAADHPYMQGTIQTDNKDYAIIKVENYILGDTHDYRLVPRENWYQFEGGTKYASPVSLEAALILSEEQMETGWNEEYLGMYDYVESYVSEQGYHVNILQDTADENVVTVSEKCAVFVADGIQYTLKGRVPLETMKEIVETMK